MAKNWFYAAKNVWPILVAAAASRKTLFYSEVAPSIPTNPLNVGAALGPIQTYCLESRLPPLTAIVVSIATGVPGDGFIAWDVDDLSSGQEKVFAYPWQLIANPFGNLLPADTMESLANEIVAEPAKALEVYKRVPDRGVAQRVFRLAVGEAYGWQCAFCQTTFSNALDAAHIKPCSQASLNLRLDVRNGLLLCATHHRLFDNRSFTVDSEYKITYYDPEALEGPYTEADTALSLSLHKQEVALPSDELLWPRIDLLKEHAGTDT